MRLYLAQADGMVSEEEAAELAAWLDHNAGAPLPAIEFLAKIVRRILADGQVTTEEKRELYQAIERVLPPEARKGAKARRNEIEESEQRELEAARARNASVYSLNFMVAGVHFENRYDVIRAHVAPQQAVFLVRDPANPYSRNAIEVRCRAGYHIGFVTGGLHDMCKVSETVGLEIGRPDTLRAHLQPRQPEHCTVL